MELREAALKNYKKTCSHVNGEMSFIRNTTTQTAHQIQCYARLRHLVRGWSHNR